MDKPNGPIWSADVFSADLLNFVIPTLVNFWGQLAPLTRLSLPFRAQSLSEACAYIGISSLLVVFLYARSHWHHPLGKLLVDFFVVTVVLSMGPVLHVFGKTLFGLPGKAIALVQMLNNAIPVRFSMCTSLALAIMYRCGLRPLPSAGPAKRYLLWP